jgi:HK97 family phage major capsid protein/HK97 family phage prohead protease
MERIVRFSADITAADTERRTIVGTVVPYNVSGSTSLGPVVFLPGSLRASQGTKLLLEHDGRRPIGKATGFVDGPDRLVGSFKISQTSAGTDSLVEASDGLRDGLSVGASILESTVGEQGELIVSAAELVEVSLVTTPAFSDALVSQVAASGDPDPETPAEEPAPSEEDAPMEETATEVAAAAVDPKPVVEAASPTIPYLTTHNRGLDNMTAGKFAKVQLEAQAGDHDAQLLVRAALDDNTTTTGAGLIPTRFLREVIGVIDTSRPFIDSLTREPLPDAGMEFKIPRRTARASVAEQAAEGDEVSSDEPTYDFLTVPVKTFAGGERISRQLIERSDPAFLDRLLIEMASEFAQATDKFAGDTVASSGVGTSDGDSIAAAIGQAISDAWSIMRFAPNNIQVAPTTTGSFGFADLLKATDSDDRPLFSGATQLVNQPGNIVVPNAAGSVMGLRLVVDGNFGATYNPMVYPSAAATFYESAGSPIQVSVQDVSTLEVEVAVYGYVGMAVKYPTAFRALTITP